MAKAWRTIFPEEDRAVYDQAGFGQRKLTFGKRPALLIIDVVESFTGKQKEDVLTSIQDYRTSCGAAAWDALPRIRQLLDAARAAGILVVYTKGDPEYKFYCGGSTKSDGPQETKETLRLHSTPIAEQVAPIDGEFVLRKTKASAFFGTPLPTYLHQRGVDTLLICGTSTSGCVRSSVVDAYSHGYATFVVDDCCFDRSQFSHNVNLYEMNSKYADVIDVEEAIQLVNSTAGQQTTTA